MNAETAAALSEGIVSKGIGSGCCGHCIYGSLVVNWWLYGGSFYWSSTCQPVTSESVQGVQSCTEVTQIEQIIWKIGCQL